MKKLEINQLTHLNGGDTAGCITGVASTIVSAVGLGLAIAFPPAGVGMAMLSGFVSGAGLGFSIGGSAVSCFA